MITSLVICKLKKDKRELDFFMLLFVIGLIAGTMELVFGVLGLPVIRLKKLG